MHVFTNMTQTVFVLFILQHYGQLQWNPNILGKFHVEFPLLGGCESSSSIEEFSDICFSCILFICTSLSRWNAILLNFTEIVYEYSVRSTYTRGLQCFKLNGNHTENDRYWQKNNFLLFAKCFKMYSFFCICILRLQKVLLWPKFFFSWKISIWVSFYADFKFVDADLKILSSQKKGGYRGVPFHSSGPPIPSQIFFRHT